MNKADDELVRVHMVDPHTPGPWRVERTNVGQPLIMAKEEVVCRIARWTIPVESADANLIAAAPELLQALKGVIWEDEPVTGDVISRSLKDLIEEHDRRIEFARAAIAKAEGR